MAVSDDTLVRSLDRFSRAAASFSQPVSEFSKSMPSFVQAVAQLSQSAIPGVANNTATEADQPTEEDAGEPSWMSKLASIIEGYQSANEEREPGWLDKLGKWLGTDKAPAQTQSSPTQSVVKDEKTPPIGGGNKSAESLLKVVTENPEALAVSTGGRISGPGSGTSDSIPAWLSHGEFVVNAADASRNAPVLDHINQGGKAAVHHSTGGWAGFPAKAKKFATGGWASVPAGAQRLAKGGFGRPVLGVPGAVRDQVGDMTLFNNQLTRGVAAVANFVESVKNNTESIIESRRNLAEVSASMAAVFASKDVNDILLNIQRGDRLAESTGWAQQQNLDLQKALIPLESLIGKIENYVSGAFSAVMARVLEAVNKYLPGGDTEGDPLFFSELIDYTAATERRRAEIQHQATIRLNPNGAEAQADLARRRADWDRLYPGANRWWHLPHGRP